MAAPIIDVLLLTSDARRQTEWGEWLELSTLRVWQSAQAVPNSSRPHVVITDAIPLPTERADGGLILVGGETPAITATDVTLPADATARELQLACQLLGELVRLRRAERKGAGELRLLEQWAMRDALTGLANRRAWDQCLADLATNSRPAPNSAVCLALLDVDDFKAANDRCGHSTGDAVLRAVAAGLQSSLRQSDLAARWGGDEFALFLPDVAGKHALSTVERIRAAAVRSIREQTNQKITLSGGLVCSTVATNCDTGALWQLADDALREAKTGGGNHSVEFTVGDAQGS